MSFRAEHLGFAYGLRDVSFDLPASGLVAVAGPNGAGKSTLLGILAGLRTPYSGRALFEGREIREWPRRDFARRVAFVAQSMKVEFPFTAEELVARAFHHFPSGGGAWGDSLGSSSGGKSRVQRPGRVADSENVRHFPRSTASCDPAELAAGGMVDADFWNLRAECEQCMAEFA